MVNIMPTTVRFVPKEITVNPTINVLSSDCQKIGENSWEIPKVIVNLTVNVVDQLPGH